MLVSPPTSENQLLERVQAIAGLSLQTLAERCGEYVPHTLKRQKGWVGQLLEIILGASASSRAAPDFELIGVELKTIPVDRQGKPFESTYVCTAPLLELTRQTWQTSWVKHKLSRVLWLPIISEPGVAIGERRVGNAILWSPSAEDTTILANDWNELTDMLCLGQLELITARHGTYLQIRPKAANSRALCWGINEQGERVPTLPRGFYLRAGFTRKILTEHFLLTPIS